jgi:hypothetical protein
MKKVALLAVLVLSVGLVVAAFAEEATEEATEKAVETPWFDMENCAFCKHLLKDPKLLENMTWEYHDVSNGLLSITTVNPECQKSYQEAMGAMMDLGAKLDKGEVDIKDLKMCGSCQHWGMLEEMGAKFEHVQGKGADIMLMTSDKPEVVKKIQEYGQRNREELAKMEEAKKAE